MATHVRYGDILIANAQTRGWSQSIQRDPSGTDAVFHRHTIEVEGLVHAQPGGYPAESRAFITGPSASAQTFGSVLDEVRRKLLVDRLPLVIEMGGTTVFAVVPSAGNEAVEYRDVDNGPKPKSVDVVHVTSAANPILRVRWTVEVCVVNCPSGSVEGAPPPAKVSPVLSNRWRVSEELDRDFYTTRTISGKLRLSQAIAEMPIKDDFRGLVIPGLEDGFRREAIEFTVTENGLEADYRVTDKQVYSAAPWPATSWSGQHSETATDHGTNLISDFTIRLDAPPDADRVALIRRALQCAEARVKFLARSSDKDLLVESFRITELIESNSVEVAVRVRQTQAGGEYFANLRSDTLGQPIDLPQLSGEPAPYDPRQSAVPAIYGYVPHEGERRPTVLMLLHCYLQWPCKNRHGIGELPLGSENEPYGESARLTPSIREHASTETLTPTQQNDISDLAQATVYTFCRMENLYRVKQMRLGLPIADKPKTDASAIHASTVFVALAPPQAWRTIRFDAEAVGDWPHIPKPVEEYEDSLLTGHLLAAEVCPFPPPTSADRRKAIFRVRGTYKYQLDRAPTDDEKLLVGTLPTVKYDAVRFDPQVAYDPNVGP